ncbi:non-ribosomal peptide synthetase [Streptomyces sp. AC555_RSS877]|uniref:non-ribosomal peptide synthetase n=1 Tax=Streptomyces sp. AC555_RSS877 TaxID=2823688 RepID=UPI001C257743|nr:non-ribosomal peptide synthetase [Streptomyces sp. AC555_RSS877]
MTRLQLRGMPDELHLPPPGPRVCDAVMERAGQHPDRPAVICGDDTLSYGELAAAALPLARELSTDGRYAGSRRIGIRSHRTVSTVALALGVSLSGRSFVFLNPEAPDGVARHIRSSSGVSVVLDPRTGERVTYPRADAEPAAAPAPEDEAYVLYTSGTSGRPKGVSVSHDNLAASNAARLTVYDGFGTPVFLLLSPFHFDSSVAGIWGTLAAGGTLVVAGEDERRNPRALVGLVARHGVTHTLTVPSFYTELLHTVREDDRLAGDLASLRLVICAGESLTRGVIDQHFALLPAVSLGNEYGPTECTVWSTCRVYDKPAEPTIGFPVPGTAVHLLDGHLREVPPGEVGQIAVSGVGVTRGYVGDEAETRARFVEVEAEAGRTVRVYLTGDLGRWSDRGGLEFVGRLDNEVKIRGVRVHLETIEEALAAHPGVQSAAVAYDTGTSVCYAFAVKEPGAEVDAASVRRFVTEALGAAVVPDRILFADTLPRSAHDKIDRAALLASVRTAVPKSTAGDGLADQVAQAWEQILGVPVRQGETGTFFDLGGNSLTVLKLSRALGKIVGRPVGVKQVYRCGTIPQQVDLLTRS